jgi:hypothetical protein
MSLMDAWKRFELEMEKRRIEAYYDNQKQILELHKSMWDRDDKNNSDMLTIQNIGKIIGKTIPMNFPLRLARIEDVYGTADTYAFKVKIETPNDTKHYTLKLNRKKIPYPQPLHNGWELYCERKPNQLIVEALGKEDLKDMGEVIRRISNLMDRILNP